MERVLLEREEDISQDQCAVNLLKDSTVVGHVSREWSQCFWHFILHAGIITSVCEVTCRRKCDMTVSCVVISDY